ncbi:hypothetical protein GGD65_006294 [Bradyrhizobium sp. CIR18]|uniref:hypothetical protein n=1 Tax=Bradyrhizobium sp. CIR18 TaxID=2663839 RepID=UPI001606BD71|nr:hypothetical protein [Bradyrhizobium sp. CIR18]MBB4365228.1 hypothetical protein [Bradyrhizobium sp. CIR18]
MPYCSFDLVIGPKCKEQGGLILENLELASERAIQLATELCIVYPELKSKGCSVRIIGADNAEVYRTPLDPAPSWMSVSISRQQQR